MKRKIFLLGVIMMSSHPLLAMKEKENGDTVNKDPGLFSPKPVNRYLHRSRFRRSKAVSGIEFTTLYHYPKLRSLFVRATNASSRRRAIIALEGVGLALFTPEKQALVLKMRAILKIKLRWHDDIHEAFNDYLRHACANDIGVATLRFHLLDYYLEKGNLEAASEQMNFLSQSMLPPDLAAYLSVKRAMIYFTENLDVESDEMHALLGHLESIVEAETLLINGAFFEKNKLTLYAINELKLILMLMHCAEGLKGADANIDAGEFIEAFNKLENLVNQLSMENPLQKLIKLKCNLLGFHIFHEDRNIGYDNDIAWNYVKDSLAGICELDLDRESSVAIDGSWKEATQSLIGHLIELGKIQDHQEEADFVLATLERTSPRFADVLQLFVGG